MAVASLRRGPLGTIKVIEFVPPVNEWRNRPDRRLFKGTGQESGHQARLTLICFRSISSGRPKGPLKLSTSFKCLLRGSFVDRGQGLQL